MAEMDEGEAQEVLAQFSHELRNFLGIIRSAMHILKAIFAWRIASFEGLYPCGATERDSERAGGRPLAAPRTAAPLRRSKHRSPLSSLISKILV